MPLPSDPAAPVSEGAPAVYDLSTPEEIRTRKRRRLLIVVLGGLLSLAVLGYFAGHPAVHAIKGWQARRLAAEAEALIDTENWREAQGKVQDACQLRATEPAVLRVAARFLTRVGASAEALEFWRQLERVRPLTPPENLDFATAAFSQDNLDAAEARLRRAWPPGTEGTPGQWRVGMKIAGRRGQNAGAIALAHKLQASGAGTERERLDAALTLLAIGAPGDQADGWTTVRQIAEGGKSAESLEALVLLGRKAGAVLAAPKSASSDDGRTASDLAGRLERHPLARVQHRLLALDLRLAQDPSKRAEVIDDAVGRFAGGDPETLAGLGAWLYARGEFKRVIEVIPEAKATMNKTLYLQYLDTLGALGRWNDIQDLIQRQKITLERSIEQMYLARCSEQVGQPKARDAHWAAAVAAAGADVEKLLTVANYASHNRALAPAEMAYREALQAKPDSRPACTGLLELFTGQGRTSDLHDLLVRMSASWPNDDAARNDAAYTGLLLGLDPAAAGEIARELVRKSPGSLPHRVTLALAELRLGHALSALEAFNGVDVNPVASQPRQLAVYAAVLWETSSEPEARRVVAQIKADSLMPEERALIEKITP